MAAQQQGNEEMPSSKTYPSRLIVFLLTAIALIFTHGVAFGTVWYVDAAGSGSCTSWPDACGTIQEAVDAAFDGDEIWVKMGTYYLTSEIVVYDKGIHFYGGFAGWETARDQRDPATNHTRIDGQGTVRCFFFWGSWYHHATIDGFTIANGYAGYLGGAIYKWGHRLTIENCNFSDNVAVVYGGAIYANYGTVYLISCTFSNNSALAGGAISGDHTQYVVEKCLFSNNSALSGGAVEFAQAELFFFSTRFSDNSAVYDGGAILTHEAFLYVENCVFSNNSAVRSGGAITVREATYYDIHNTFFANTATLYGGGISFFQGGYRIYTLTNSIFWANAAQEGPQIYYDDRTIEPTITYSDIQGGFPGVGNIDADPLFVDPFNGDFHLQLGSPSINAGDPLPLPLKDFEGDPRILGSAPDMGADEFLLNVTVDIKPGICSNECNLKANGKFPVTILGTEDFDGADIDPATIELAGVAPLRWSIEDITTTVAEDSTCTEVEPDGNDDLSLKFDTQEIVNALGSISDGDVVELTLHGLLLDGTPFEGTDSIVVLHRGGGKSE